jgi:hypothetical protein
MSSDLPPPSVFWDIVHGKMRVVDDLKPNAKVFLDVAEAWRWSKKVADQETWLWMVELHLRLSSGLVMTSAPVSWSYFGDVSWWTRNHKVQQSGVGFFPRGDAEIRGKIWNFLVFYERSQLVTEFYEKKEILSEVAFYAVSRKERKVILPAVILKRAFITDRTLRSNYHSWDFEIMADEAWRTNKLW